MPSLLKSWTCNVYKQTQSIICYKIKTHDVSLVPLIESMCVKLCLKVLQLLLWQISCNK
jgi:hypothetical protein